MTQGVTEFVVKLVSLSGIPRILHSGTPPCCPLTWVFISFIVMTGKIWWNGFFLNYLFYFLRLNTISPFLFLSSNPTTRLPYSCSGCTMLPVCTFSELMIGTGQQLLPSSLEETISSPWGFLSCLWFFVWGWGLGSFLSHPFV